MELVGLKPVADRLGVSVSKLRYFLNKDRVVPYRQLDIDGQKHLRCFTKNDVEAIEKWWNAKTQNTN